VRTNEGVTKAIVTAMFAAQTNMKAAVKDATNPAFRSKYADLGSVWEACRDALKAAKVLVSQDVTSDDCGVSITTRFTVESEQWMEFGPLYIPLAKKDAQAVGSAISYGRRYSLSAALGIIAEDDDGNAAVASMKPYEADKIAKAQQKRVATPDDPPPIDRAQQKAIVDAAEQNGWRNDDVKRLIASFGFSRSSTVTVDKLPLILDSLQNGATVPHAPQVGVVAAEDVLPI
jgi:hypothetical protein